jgi:hypothetical protein
MEISWNFTVMSSLNVCLLDDLVSFCVEVIAGLLRSEIVLVAECIAGSLGRHVVFSDDFAHFMVKGVGVCSDIRDIGVVEFNWRVPYKGLQNKHGGRVKREVKL